MQSAATRSAKARTAAIADVRVSPYAMTPGMDSMSAHQRPSSSRPVTIGIDSTVTVSIFLGSLTRHAEFVVTQDLIRSPGIENRQGSDPGANRVDLFAIERLLILDVERPVFLRRDIPAAWACAAAPPPITQ